MAAIRPPCPQCGTALTWRPAWWLDGADGDEPIDMSHWSCAACLTIWRPEHVNDRQADMLESG